MMLFRKSHSDSHTMPLAILLIACAAVALLFAIWVVLGNAVDIG